MSKRRPTPLKLPRKEPKQERSRQTYQVILIGAAKILRRVGVHKFSTNKVAEESGVSIGSLYQYFPSKEAIIAALMDQLFETEYLRMKELLGRLEPKMGAREVFKQVFSQYYTGAPEDLNYKKIMIDAMVMVDKTVEALKFHKSVAELIVVFTQEHYFDPGSVKDHKTTIFLIQYMLRATALSSADKDLDTIHIVDVVEELSEGLMGLLKIPQEYRGAIT